MNIFLVNADTQHSPLSALLNELAVCTLWDAGHALKVSNLECGNISSDEELDRLQWCDLCILSFSVVGASVPVELKSWVALMLRAENSSWLRFKKIMLTIVEEEQNLQKFRAIRALFEDLVPRRMGFEVITPFLACSNSPGGKGLSSILFEYESRLLNIHRAAAVCGRPVEKSNQGTGQDFVFLAV